MAIEGLDFRAGARAAGRAHRPAGAARGARRGAGRSTRRSTPPTPRRRAGSPARLESAQGAEAAGLSRRRGLDRDTIRASGSATRPTTAPRSSARSQAEGYAEATLLEAGLLARREDGGPSLRPLPPPGRCSRSHDQRGRIVGFGGRALGEARAKYLNTPETELFHKGELLYDLPLARAAVRERGTVIVAEGYMDVIALAQAGLRQRGGAARHRGDRGAARPALAAGRRAGGLPRRRRGRPARGAPR